MSPRSRFPTNPQIKPLTSIPSWQLEDKSKDRHNGRQKDEESIENGKMSNIFEDDETVERISKSQRRDGEGTASPSNNCQISSPDLVLNE